MFRIGPGMRLPTAFMQRRHKIYVPIRECSRQPANSPNIQRGQTVQAADPPRPLTGTKINGSILPKGHMRALTSCSAFRPG